MRLPRNRCPTPMASIRTRLGSSTMAGPPRRPAHPLQAVAVGKPAILGQFGFDVFQMEIGLVPGVGDDPDVRLPAFECRAAARRPGSTSVDLAPPRGPITLSLMPRQPAVDRAGRPASGACPTEAGGNVPATSRVPRPAVLAAGRRLCPCAGRPVAAVTGSNGAQPAAVRSASHQDSSDFSARVGGQLFGPACRAGRRFFAADGLVDDVVQNHRRQIW